MVAVFFSDFQSLKDEIARLEERGENDAADRLRSHLAKLEAMKLSDEERQKKKGN